MCEKKKEKRKKDEAEVIRTLNPRIVVSANVTGFGCGKSYFWTGIRRATVAPQLLIYQPWKIISL